MLRAIPCILMRGGSSKGLFFLASDLPRDPEMRNRVLLAAMGSPDTRQIDGMGGGDDLTSKVVIVGPSGQPDADVEYLFAQVSVARDLVDILPNSGNMLAGVAPFAIGHGLVKAGNPATTVRILNLNTGKIVEAEVQTPGGTVTFKGDCHLDGVPGTSAPIRLNFLDPAGTRTGGLLPTGRPTDQVLGVPVSCADFANPIVFIAAGSLGKSGHESKKDLDGDTALLARIERIRCKAAVLMGLGDVSGKGLPKVVLLAPPRDGGSIASRYFVPSSCHAAHAVTGALCLGAACHIPGTVAAGLVTLDPADPERIVIEHPSGQVETQVRIAVPASQKAPLIRAASIVTTARPLLSGVVYVPQRVWPTEPTAP